eukprot:SAG31_NODE_11813_length_995_cov_2.772321_1_plen_173_part_00
MYNHYHAAGYALDPEFIDADLTEADPEIMEGLNEVCERLYHDDADKCAIAMAQFDEFRAAGSKFKSPVCSWRLAAKRMPTHRFWRQYGTIAKIPELTYVAMRVLSKQAGVGPIERSHKITKSHVHTAARGNMHPKNVSREVFISINQRLVDKLEEFDYSEEYEMPESSSDED